MRKKIVNNSISITNGYIKFDYEAHASAAYFALKIVH